jgi:hypothetical protein
VGTTITTAQDHTLAVVAMANLQVFYSIIMMLPVNVMDGFISRYNAP